MPAKIGPNDPISTVTRGLGPPRRRARRLLRVFLSAVAATVRVIGTPVAPGDGSDARPKDGTRLQPGAVSHQRAATPSSAHRAMKPLRRDKGAPPPPTCTPRPKPCLLIVSGN